MDWSSDQFSCWEILHQTFASTKLEIHVLTRNTVREMESAYWNFEHNISICAMRACKCQISSPIHVKKPNPFTSLSILWHKSMLATHSGSWGQLTGSSLRTFQLQLYRAGVDLTYFCQYLLLKWFRSVMIDMIIWQSIWSKLASWTYSGITLDIKVFSLWRTS